MEVHDFLDSAGVAAVGTDGHMCLAAGVQEMSEQLQLEEYRHLNLAPYETHPRILRRCPLLCININAHLLLRYVNDHMLTLA